MKYLRRMITEVFVFTRQILTDSLNALELLVWPLCEKYGISKTSLALSYILSYEAVSTVITRNKNRPTCN
jgi:hypothetical protein